MRNKLGHMQGTGGKGSQAKHRGGDSEEEAISRLTYRTARVLSAIASAEGASNRRIAQLAEIKDEGQTSKLLHRLARQGYLRKQPGAAGKANAWFLTAAGKQLQQAVASQIDLLTRRRPPGSAAGKR